MNPIQLQIGNAANRAAATTRIRRTAIAVASGQGQATDHVEGIECGVGRRHVGEVKYPRLSTGIDGQPVGARPADRRGRLHGQLTVAQSDRTWRCEHGRIEGDD